jgi:hypothetical protein
MEDLLRKIEERIANKQFLDKTNIWTYKLKYKFYDCLIDHKFTTEFIIAFLCISLLACIMSYFALTNMFCLMFISFLIGFPTCFLVLNKINSLANILIDEVS